MHGSTHEDLTAFLRGHGIEHFSGAEVCTLRRAGIVVDPPPSAQWDRILPVLGLAEDLRAALGHPLVIGNGYRPDPYNRRVGGARNSQHLHFRALDLDLPKGHTSRDNQEALYYEAARLYLERGEDMRIGFGIYSHRRGRRVHLDAGYRRRAWSRRYVRPLLESMR